ncbi:hypothetical protein IQ268_23475 [Oculatella sp. LEGE 06141]|uniref:hypothetical protein n=1 Tax=Oculatella sp. LEGE 06141 TaxID=1828648 RepID=UPI001881472A|nr:hypothetical protein [Oculatella sp. LEGE 06141]MBE9181527.1 hypothetical protein [Oculatella sp. LEGE 06141]
MSFIHRYLPVPANQSQRNDSRDLDEAQTLSPKPLQRTITGFSGLSTAWLNVMSAANVQAFLEQFAIAAEESTKLQISQKRNHQGQDVWTVYNPRTGRSLTCYTEEEVQIWYKQQAQDRANITSDRSWNEFAAHRWSR